MDETQERELDSQLFFCILKKKILVGPAMKVLDSKGCLKPGIEAAELTPLFNLWSLKTHYNLTQTWDQNNMLVC